TRRRPELLAGPVAVRAQLVVLGALVLVAQHLVGLVDGLEALLGARLLADVGVVLARQPAVGGLDLRLAGRRLDAEGFVVVLELHGLALSEKTPTAEAAGAVYAGSSFAAEAAPPGPASGDLDAARGGLGALGDGD